MDKDTELDVIETFLLGNETLELIKQILRRLKDVSEK